MEIYFYLLFGKLSLFSESFFLFNALLGSVGLLLERRTVMLIGQSVIETHLQSTLAAQDCDQLSLWTVEPLAAVAFHRMAFRCVEHTVWPLWTRVIAEWQVIFAEGQLAVPALQG